jgi:Tfp pilus assembly protein PilO
MPDLAKSRRKLKIAIGAMLAVDVIAVAVLFSPLVGSTDSRQQQLNQLRFELLKKSRDVAPLRGMDKKLELAKDQINGFYKDRFATTDSDLLKQLGELESQNGVHIQQARYKEEDPASPGLIPFEIEGSFSGDYLQLVRFINALERSKLFFDVDGVDLAGESAGSVRLQITMHSYLRSGV